MNAESQSVEDASFQPSLMLLMLKSERELATEAIRQERLTNVLPLFSPYLAGVPL